MSSKHKFLAAALLLSAAFAAHADKTNVEQMIDLSEQAQLAELQAKINGKSGVGGAPGAGSLPAIPMPEVSSKKSRDADDFRVIAIYGSGKNLRAEIQFSRDSGIAVVTKGQKIFGWTIDGIDSFQVKASRLDEKGRTATLYAEVQNSSWASPTPSPNNVPGAMPLPPIPSPYAGR